MRRAALLLLLATVFLASPAGAQGFGFGDYRCKLGVQCSTLSDPETLRANLARIIAAGNSCLRGRLPIPSDGNYFNETLGIDGSGCLSSKAPEKAASGLTLYSQCCIDAAACVMNCRIYGTR